MVRKFDMIPVNKPYQLTHMELSVKPVLVIFRLKVCLCQSLYLQFWR